MLIRFNSISALRLSKRMRGKEPVWEMSQMISRLSLRFPEVALTVGVRCYGDECEGGAGKCDQSSGRRY